MVAPSLVSSSAIKGTRGASPIYDFVPSRCLVLNAAGAMVANSVMWAMSIALLLNLRTQIKAGALR